MCRGAPQRGMLLRGARPRFRVAAPCRELGAIASVRRRWDGTDRCASRLRPSNLVPQNIHCAGDSVSIAFRCAAPPCSFQDPSLHTLACRVRVDSPAIVAAFILALPCSTCSPRTAVAPLGGGRCVAWLVPSARHNPEVSDFLWRIICDVEVAASSPHSSLQSSSSFRSLRTHDCHR